MNYAVKTPSFLVEGPPPSVSRLRTSVSTSKPYNPHPPASWLRDLPILFFSLFFFFEVETLHPNTEPQIPLPCLELGTLGTIGHEEKGPQLLGGGTSRIPLSFATSKPYNPDPRSGLILSSESYCLAWNWDMRRKAPSSLAEGSLGRLLKLKTL